MSESILDLMDNIISKSNEIIAAGKAIVDSTDEIIAAFGARPISKGFKYTIIITQDKHYIEGDRFYALLRNNTVPISSVQYMTSLGEIKGNVREVEDMVQVMIEKTGLQNFEIIYKTNPDPNFESAEAAEEYLNNK